MGAGKIARTSELARALCYIVAMPQSVDLRREYGVGRESPLDEAKAHADPFVQFGVWFDEAKKAGVPDVNAMALATCTVDGLPSARIVLLKSFDERGFVFYTNHNSRKAQEMHENPRAALLFYWAELERQVRIEGVTEHVSHDEAAAYFHTRPRGAQLGAWASEQSHPVASRTELEKRYAELDAEYAGREVPLPPFWGGVRLTPTAFEFWQGRTNRLHDRLRYVRHDVGYRIERLAP